LNLVRELHSVLSCGITLRLFAFLGRLWAYGQCLHLNLLRVGSFLNLVLVVAAMTLVMLPLVLPFSPSLALFGDFVPEVANKVSDARLTIVFAIRIRLVSVSDCSKC